MGFIEDEKSQKNLILLFMLLLIFWFFGVGNIIGIKSPIDINPFSIQRRETGSDEIWARLSIVMAG